MSGFGAEPKRTGLGPQALPQSLRRFTGFALSRPKRPDRYWSAPRDTKRPAISTAKIGYVRRSDLIAVAIGATRDAAEVAQGRGLRAARLHAIKKLAGPSAP